MKIAWFFTRSSLLCIGLPFLSFSLKVGELSLLFSVVVCKVEYCATTSAELHLNLIQIKTNNQTIHAPPLRKVATNT